MVEMGRMGLFIQQRLRQSCLLLEKVSLKVGRFHLGQQRFGQKYLRLIKASLHLIKARSYHLGRQRLGIRYLRLRKLTGQRNENVN
jgi:hypothetical protein